MIEAANLATLTFSRDPPTPTAERLAFPEGTGANIIGYEDRPARPGVMVVTFLEVLQRSPALRALRDGGYPAPYLPIGRMCTMANLKETQEPACEGRCEREHGGIDGRLHAERDDEGDGAGGQPDHGDVVRSERPREQRGGDQLHRQWHAEDVEQVGGIAARSGRSTTWLIARSGGAGNRTEAAERNAQAVMAGNLFADHGGHYAGGAVAIDGDGRRRGRDVARDDAEYRRVRDRGDGRGRRREMFHVTFRSAVGTATAAMTWKQVWASGRSPG